MSWQKVKVLTSLGKMHIFELVGCSLDPSPKKAGQRVLLTNLVGFPLLTHKLLIPAWLLLTPCKKCSSLFGGLVENPT